MSLATPRRSQGNGVRLCRMAVLCVLLAIACAASEPPPAVSDSHSVSTETIVQRLVDANNRRANLLRAYSATRLYKLEYQGFTGTRNAEMKVAASFIAPDKKDFNVVSNDGSGFLLNHVLYKLLSTEKSAIEEDAGHGFDVTPENYEFKFIGTDHLPTGDAYVLEVKPRTSNKYLYIGKIWVNVRDSAVARIQAEPAKSQSFWIKSTNIDLTYGKFGDFWFPVRNQSSSHTRLGGEALLTIQYTDYRINDPQLAAQGHPSPGSSVAIVSPASVVATDLH